MVKNLPANAGDIRDMGLIPEAGRSPRGGHQIVQNGTNSANSANSFSRLNVIPMVTTKKIAREYTQKEMRRELKILPQKFNRKEDRNSGNDR